MDYLLDFAGRDDVLTLATEYLRQNEAVQGIAVDLDDLWLAEWRLYNSLPPRAFAREASLLRESLLHEGLGWYRHRRLLDSEFVSYPFGVDPHWRSNNWNRIVKWREINPEPFVMIVVLRPDVSRESLGALAEIDPRGIQVRLEPRPTPRLYAKSTDRVRPLVGGLSVSSPTGPPGTLGGILTDTSGGKFGLTCSHVLAIASEAQQPSPADNGSDAERIGKCVESSKLASHTGQLDPYSTSINTIDAALIELEPGAQSALEVLDVGPLAGIAPKGHVNPGASVEVVGKAVGKRSLYIGAVTLVQEFDLNGSKYGFRNLFELRRYGRFAAITGTISHPVKPGDSGGWVLRSGTSGPEWLGVVIAGDGPYGYAIPAEFIVDWIGSTKVGTVDVR